MDSTLEGGGGQLFRLLLNDFRRRAVRFIEIYHRVNHSNVTNRGTFPDPSYFIFARFLRTAIRAVLSPLYISLTTTGVFGFGSRRVYLPLHPRPFFLLFSTISLCRCKKLKRWNGNFCCFDEIFTVEGCSEGRPASILSPSLSDLRTRRRIRSLENILQSYPLNLFGLLTLRCFFLYRNLRRRFNFTCQWNFDKESNSIILFRVESI